ncbi:AraC family transcriptional regulator [Paenibacillus sp. PL2-23]|uniref:helix-turn-helix transcriptional regulator n=1 Tax=Paenibacillus sp. PL2-23 TaxID=2100729 RepID=UPI0030F9A05B
MNSLHIHWAGHHHAVTNWRMAAPGNRNSLILVTQGECCYDIGDKQVIVRQGELIFLSEHLPRIGSSDKHTPHSRYTVNFTIDGDIRLPLFMDRHNHKLATRQFHFIQSRFSSLVRCWREKYSYFEITCHAILYELLALMNREVEDKKVSPHKHVLAEQLKEYLNQSFCRKITIQELAEVIGRCPNYVNIIFQEVQGTSPIAYMHMLRVERAKELLENSGLSIGDIAEQVGYNNQPYFHFMFKKLTGHTPGEFR